MARVVQISDTHLSPGKRHFASNWETLVAGGPAEQTARRGENRQLMARVVQISDTHLSPGKRHFASNWEPLLAWVQSQQPDLAIHTGDVTVDGADVEEDMTYGAGPLPALRAPVFCVPGNHDVGEANSPFQPVNGERITRW